MKLIEDATVSVIMNKFTYLLASVQSGHVLWFLASPLRCLLGVGVLGPSSTDAAVRPKSRLTA